MNLVVVIQLPEISQIHLFCTQWLNTATDSFQMCAWQVSLPLSYVSVWLLFFMFCLVVGLALIVAVEIQYTTNYNRTHSVFQMANILFNRRGTAEFSCLKQRK